SSHPRELTSFPTRRSSDLTPLPDGGERVVMTTDRYIGFWEAANRPRSIDYPFTLIELHINANGEGEGKMSLATKITADKESNTRSEEHTSELQSPDHLVCR